MQIFLLLLLLNHNLCFSMFNFVFVLSIFYTSYSALTPPSLEVFILDGGVRKTLTELL